MQFRCSNSAASAALLAGGVAFALLQPDHCAADPIEFSSSSVPLGVPRAVVQIKETDSDKFVASQDPVGGMIDESAMMPSSGGGMIITHKGRRDAWNLNPLPDNGSGDLNDPFSRSWGQIPNGWSSSSSATSNSATAFKNSNDRVWGRPQQDNTGMFRHFDNSMYGSAPGNDSLASRFGLDNQREGSQPRESNRFNRDEANQGEGSIWSKIFNHESGVSEHFAFSRADSADGASQAPVSAFSDRYKPAGAAGGLGAGMESGAESQAASGSTGTFYTPTDGRSSRDGSGNGSIPGFATPQKPSNPQHWASRSFFSKPAESRASRYGVPERPGVLVMPKRPNDP